MPPPGTLVRACTVMTALSQTQTLGPAAAARSSPFLPPCND